MTRGVRLYLVGSFVLVSLAGCGRGLFQTEEREPWRAEAEIACLKSGAVKEGPDLVRVDPISGPGICGAEFPLKVAALGEGGAATVSPTICARRPESAARPSHAGPATSRNTMPTIPPARLSRTAAPHAVLCGAPQPLRRGANRSGGNGPVSLNAPGVAAGPRRHRPSAGRRGCRPTRPPHEPSPAYPATSITRRRRAARYPNRGRAAVAAARSGAGQCHRLGRSGRDQAGRDAGLSDRLGAGSAGSPTRCSRRRCAGSASRWSRSSRFRPIPAAA